MIDPVAEAAFFDFVKDFKPQIRIHAGDAWDMRNLRGGCNDSERTESMLPDWDAGCLFLSRFLSQGEERYFLRGNHERIWLIDTRSNGMLHDYCQQGIRDAERLFRKYKITSLPYDARLGILKLGHLKVIHGYAIGIGAASKHARIYGNVFFGHTHTMDVAPVENDDGPSEARGIGCLCQIDMPYNARQTNKLRHSQGWVYGELFDDGTYQAMQAKRIGDSFYAATTIKRYGS